MTKQTKTIRLKVSPEVARIITPGAPREAKLDAARGVLPLAGNDLVPVLFLLCHVADPEIRTQALETFKRLPSHILLPVLEESPAHPQLLDFVCHWRIAEPEVIGPLLDHPELTDATLLHVAGRAGDVVLSLLADSARCSGHPEVVAAILANPSTTEDICSRLAPTGGVAGARANAVAAAELTGEGPVDDEGEVEEESAEEELNLSKYQMALEMGVSDKIKTAMTGDKEWRSIFLKDPNKLVSSAVMKNPRITDGEVLTVAKNKSTNDELIRLITFNREWVKNYEIKRALVLHPRTPLPKALRYMDILTEKDLKRKDRPEVCRKIFSVK